MHSEAIGKYRIVRDLGSGAHGRIFKANDTVLDRAVALKRLKSDSGSRTELLREAKMLARLNHPNIVTLYDVFDHGGEIYLAMEFVDGESLSERLRRGPLNINDALAIADRLAAALGAAHDLGVAHGDIKPANIMLDRKGAPLLIDFGLARFSDRDNMLATATAGGEITTSLAGTLPYMAPETIMGAPADARADLFSLGAVLYEMLAGARAFDAPAQGAVLQKVLNDEPQPLRKRRPEISPPVEALVDRLLNKTVQARFQSAASFRAALEAATRSGAMAALKARAQLMLRPLIKRRTAPGWLKLGAGLAAAGLVAWSAAMLITDVAPPVSVRMNEGIDLVRHFEKKNAVKNAQDIFGRILADDPDHAAANAGLALALIREYTSMETDPATLRRATAYAEAALKGDPHLALANIAAAWAAEFNSDFERAHELYDAAALLDPNNPLIFEGRARTLKKQGDYDGAIAVLEQAIETYPEDRVFYDDYGALLSRRGDYVRAEVVLQQSISISPDNPQAYASLSHVLHMQGKTTEAITVVQDGLKVEQNANLYNNLGAYLFFQGRYEEAAKAFERTLELQGNSHDYFYWANLADAYRWTPGKSAEARSAYQQAIQLIQRDIKERPNHTGLHSRLSLYAAKSGNTVLAETSLKVATKPPVTQPIIYYRAAITEELIGHRNSALEMLAQAIDAGYPINEIVGDPELEQLRQDPAYQQLLVNRGVSHG